MKLFYFSTALSDEIFRRITGKCRTFKPTFSGVGFDRNIAEGLSGHLPVEAVSYYPIPSYPKYSRLFEGADAYSKGNLHCTVSAMLNLPVLKEFWYCRQAVRKVRRSDPGDGVLLISGLYRCLLRPAKRLKKKYGMPVYAIVPDLPELMSTYRRDYSGLRRFLNRLDVQNSAKYRQCVDGFVLLSRHMNAVVNPENKPYIVVDGLCDLSAVEQARVEVQKQPPQEKYILYAGKITQKFGVDRLIEGFRQADLPGVKLILCGDGDLAETVRRAAAEDARIEYRGLVSHSEVLALECGAALLAEPRPTDDILVKMSFPSKIIEYMASGTPVLTTALPCFAEEYRSYQYRIEEETPEGICRALRVCLALPEAERRAMGEKARAFVQANKSKAMQCARIFAFIGGDRTCGSEEINI